MRKSLSVVSSLLLGTIVSSSGLAQIQSFEFGYGLTNNLSIPAGKVIRIHSLLASSSQGGVHYTYNQTGLATGVINSSQRGISIILASGRSFTLSPFNVSLGGTDVYLTTSVLSSINSVTPNNPLLVPGPITISKSSDDLMLLVYEIQDNLGSTSLAQAPSQGSSVVIPTSAAGDVDVKMEQSADNVTWTECLPGTYNSSTVKRFFRLRAVEK